MSEKSLRERVAEEMEWAASQLAVYLRHLRAKNDPMALAFTNALAEFNDVRAALARHPEEFSLRHRVSQKIRELQVMEYRYKNGATDQFQVSPDYVLGITHALEHFRSALAASPAAAPRCPIPHGAEREMELQWICETCGHREDAGEVKQGGAA